MFRLSIQLLRNKKKTIPPQDKNANSVQTMLHIHIEQQYSCRFCSY